MSNNSPNNTSSKTKQTQLHEPVMVDEVLAYLKPQADRHYIDATFGRGGHAQELLTAKAKVIAFDIDQEAIKFAQTHFADELKKQQLTIINCNFSQLESAVSSLNLDQAEIAPIHGILFDFGTSHDQIKAPHRGFSFDHLNDPLDMRMNQELGVTAADLLHALSTKQLEKLFRNFGGESKSRQIAKAIERYQGKEKSNKIETVGQLVKIVGQIKQRHSHLHPATKVFQALRIAVNSELDAIKQALPQALEILSPQGVIVTIAFHQGEDVIVKTLFRDWLKKGRGEILTPKPLQPSETEKTKNPASRSAKLRVFRKKN